MSSTLSEERRMQVLDDSPGDDLPRLLCQLNGQPTALPVDSSQRASAFLREELRLRGTKVGCQQGDCGSCTIMVDGEAVYACLVPAAQLAGRRVVTVEGLCEQTACGARLQDAFLAHQAVQCGFCTPGMLMACAAAIDAGHVHDRDDAKRAMAGVLCRCTGYQKIVDAVAEVGSGAPPRIAPTSAPVGTAVGAPIMRLDGRQKADGSQHFGADGIPAESLYIRAIRSPHHRAGFEFGDIDAFVRAHSGIHKVLTHQDVPALNVHGAATPYADQPVLPNGETRHYFEAVALVVGERAAVAALDLSAFPVRWWPLEAALTPQEASAPDAALLHANRPENVLIEGLVSRGSAAEQLGRAAHVVQRTFSTSFVEHAYLEPEAGWAVRRGPVIEVHSPTQAPHSHRDDLAKILGVDKENVHVKPSAVGGGFGGKLDMTVQPLLAIAAWHLDRPVAMVLSREESIATSTKRHPAHMTSSIGADADGRIVAVEFSGDFNTGAYASWGTAVATRVPVHASGPYHVPHYRAKTRAVHTHVTPAGAFRGFGVPQAMIAQEQLIDELAHRTGHDPLAFRLLNALRPGHSLPTGQVLDDSVGIVECLEALRPDWEDAKFRTAEKNRSALAGLRFGVGLAAFFYGCGNTALANPSTIRIGIKPTGEVILHQGAVDAGQGSNTVIPQIAADALGIDIAQLCIVGADTNHTPDCGRTSASRQTFVTGKAAYLAGTRLRARITTLLDVQADARLHFGEGRIEAGCGDAPRLLCLHDLPVDDLGYVMLVEERFDPSTTTLDANGQGSPYAVYAFGAQMAEVMVDVETGQVQVLRVVAAHDVGRVINPSLLEGQIEGAVAQGVGLALMEQFHPAVNNNLHDYLIPTVHDMPEVKCIFVEARSSVGPYGAKGIGEPALVPTAAAIFNAIHHATGARITVAPATPEVVSRAIDTARI